LGEPSRPRRLSVQKSRFRFAGIGSFLLTRQNFPSAFGKNFRNWAATARALPKHMVSAGSKISLLAFGKDG
jgi:hypothetical protein